MSYYTTLATTIHGTEYTAGQVVNTDGWSRNQILQFLGLGLIAYTWAGYATPGGDPVDPAPIPYAPSQPVLSAAPHGYVVSWDGNNEDGGTAQPVNWARVEVHSSTTFGFTPNDATLRGSFDSPRGGTLVCIAGSEYVLGVADTYQVLLLHRNTSDFASGPSPTATIKVGQVAPIDIGDLSLTVTKFNTQSHQLY